MVLEDEAATVRLGMALGRHLRAGQGVALTGDLGAGKTCMTRGIARGIGVDAPEEVCSPTYLLVVEHPGTLPLIHIDAYLPAKTRGFLEEGGVDYLAELRGVVVVEWADRVADLLPAHTLWIELKPLEIDGRAARVAALEGGPHFAWIGGIAEEWGNAAPSP